MIIKIMDENGDFSRGGSYVRFTKKGKAWSSLGYMKSHLRQLSDDEIKKHYGNCTIVMVDDDNDYVKSETPFSKFLIEYIEDRAKKEIQKKISSLKGRKEFLENEIQKHLSEINKIGTAIERIENESN